MEKHMYELKVDEDLQKVAPPLADFEIKMLQEDILEHGCKCPLIVWGDTLVDGHNRYHICREAGIPFAIEQMDFSDKTEAKLWIVKNQLGRRNLKDFQRCEMVLPLADEIKAEAEERRRAGISAARTGNEMKQTFASSQPTRNILADMAGVSYATLDKVRRIVVGADEETLEKLRSGEMKIHTAFLQIRKKENSKKSSDEKKDITCDLEAMPHSFNEKNSTESVGHTDRVVENDQKLSEEDDEPSGIDEIVEQMDYAFRTFQEDFNYALDWFSAETATRENEEKVMNMIDELMKKAKEAVSQKMEELR